MDDKELILQKLDEINERLDVLISAPFVKTTKKKKPQSGRRDYTMSYKNSKGEVSERDINVSKVKASNDGKAVISGFCFLSDAPKTFNASNIIYLTPLPDGERLETYDDIIKEMSSWV